MEPVGDGGNLGAGPGQAGADAETGVEAHGEPGRDKAGRDDPAEGCAPQANGEPGQAHEDGDRVLVSEGPRGGPRPSGIGQGKPSGETSQSAPEDRPAEGGEKPGGQPAPALEDSHQGLEARLLLEQVSQGPRPRVTDRLHTNEAAGIAPNRAGVLRRCRQDPGIGAGGGGADSVQPVLPRQFEHHVGVDDTGGDAALQYEIAGTGGRVREVRLDIGLPTRGVGDRHVSLASGGQGLTSPRAAGRRQADMTGAGGPGRRYPFPIRASGAGPCDTRPAARRWPAACRPAASSWSARPRRRRRRSGPRTPPG